MPGFHNKDRHGFWSKPSDAGINAMKAVFLGIQALSMKHNGLFKKATLRGSNIRQEVAAGCDAMIHSLVALMLADNLLFKIMHAHSRHRIERLQTALKASRRRSQSISPEVSGSLDEDAVERVTIQNLESDEGCAVVDPDAFTEKEKESAKTFLATYFDIPETHFPKNELTPQAVVKVIMSTNTDEVMMASTHGSLSKYIIKKMLDYHGLGDVEKKFNKEKYGTSSRRLSRPAGGGGAKDAATTSMTVLLSTLPLILEVMLSTQEHDQELMQVSGELDRFTGKGDGNTMESIENQHGQIDKNIRDIFIDIAMKSDDRALVANIFEFFCLQAAVDHEKQITKMGTLNASTVTSHNFYSPKIEALLSEKATLLQKLQIVDTYGDDAKTALKKVDAITSEITVLQASLEGATKEIKEQADEIDALKLGMAEMRETLEKSGKTVIRLRRELAEAKQKVQSGGGAVVKKPSLPLCPKKCPAKVSEVLSGLVVAVGTLMVASGLSLFAPQVASIVFGGAFNINPLAAIMVVAGVLVGGLAALGVHKARTQNREWKLLVHGLDQSSRNNPEML